MTGPAPIDRGERPLQVFISSVIEGLTNARACVADVARELNMHPWVFEQTPAHSGGLETSYLEQVEQSEFVIWLEAGRTTEPVEREVRRAVASPRTRLLVFRLPTATRDERTQRLIDDVRERVKYAEVDEDGLADAVRATLDDEIARAVRRRERPDRFALPPRASLRGRDEIAKEVAAAVAHNTVVAISGLGGVGKSALAVDVAHRQDDVDRALLVSLRGLQDRPASPDDLLVELLEAIGVPPEEVPPTGHERSVLWCGTTEWRSLVVVLDDARDEAQVRPLLPGSGNRVVITSRATLAGLDARLVQLDVLSPYDARDVLADTARRERVEESPESAAELCELCGFLPLALYIAGRRLASRPAWAVEDLVTRLRDERRRLDALQVGDVAVRASFNLSYDQLNDAEARTFRRLGMFRSPLIREEAVAAAAGDEAPNVLERLSDLGLLESVGGGMYRIHDLLRVFAAERFEAEDDRAARADAHGMLARYFADEGAVRRDALEAPEADYDAYRDALRWFDAEFATIVELVATLDAAGLDAELEDVAAVVARYAALRRRWERWARVCEHAIASAERTGDHEALARARQNLGIALLEQGDEAGGRAQFELALHVAEELGEPAAQARAIAQLGSANKRAGDPAAGAERLRRAVELYREADDRAGEASALGDLGNALDSLGDLDGAIEAHRQAIETFQQTGYSHGEALERGNLAIALAQINDLAGAEAEARAAIALHERLDDELLAAKARLQLSGYLLADGRPEDALTEAESSRAEYARLGNLAGEAAATAARARAYATLDDPVRAIADHERAEALFSRTDADFDRARHLGDYAETRAGLDELPAARALLERALGIAEGDTTEELRVRLLGYLAELDDRDGDPDAAERRLRAEVATATEVGNELGAAFTLLALAHLHATWGEAARAREVSDEARALGAEGGLGDLTEVVVTGDVSSGERRRLGRIVTQALSDLGVPLPRLSIDVQTRSTPPRPADWWANPEGIGFDPWIVRTPDERAYVRLAATLYGAITHHVLAARGVDNTTPLGETLLDVTRAWVQHHVFVVHGPMPEDSPALPALTQYSTGADISTALGAALAGNSVAAARFEEWRRSAPLHERVVTQQIAHELGGIAEPSKFLDVVSRVYRDAERGSRG